MPHPHPLPADLSVPALARWLRFIDHDEATYESQARAVRALLADVARKAAAEALEGGLPYVEDESNPAYVARANAELDAIVSRILGSEVAP